MAAYSSGVLPLMSMSVLRGVGFLLLILLLRVVPGRLALLELDMVPQLKFQAPFQLTEKKTVSRPYLTSSLSLGVPVPRPTQCMGGA